MLTNDRYLQSKLAILIALTAIITYAVYAEQNHVDTNQTNLSELKFEQFCPDSNGYTTNFIYEDFNSPYLKELRTRFNLDYIIKDCNSEYDKVLAVMNWVHHLWQHNGYNEPIKSDPISILEEVFEHKKQFRCVEYSVVLAGCLNALGLRSRALSLMTSDVETRETGAGHLVVEVYLPSLQKWILADAQFNLQPTLNNLPLNAIELQEALRVQSSKIKFASLDPDLISDKYTKSEIENYYQDFIKFIGQYLYYFNTKINGKYWNQSGSAVGQSHRLMLVPLGAKKPTVFQIKYPLNNIEYTNSIACFYQSPI